MAKISGLQVTCEEGSTLYIDRKNSSDIFENIDMNVKPTEFISFDSNEEARALVERVCTDYNPDIIVAGQLPVPSIEMRFRIFKMIYNVTIAFKPTSEIISLQKQIMDGLYIIDPTEHPIIGAVHIKRIRNDFKYDAYIPIALSFDWVEDRFFIKVDESVDIRGKEAELLFESFQSVMVGSKYGIVNAPEKYISWIYDQCSAELINCNKLAHSAFMIWYAIQVTLLNPLCKEFTSTTTVVQETTSNKKQKKPPKKKYIKRLYIDTNKMDELGICVEKNKHKFKSPIWWVMGHWRQYKSGKRVFIKGYWKGALRELQNSESRERVIDVGDEINGTVED